MPLPHTRQHSVPAHRHLRLQGAWFDLILLGRLPEFYAPRLIVLEELRISDGACSGASKEKAVHVVLTAAPSSEVPLKHRRRRLGIIAMVNAIEPTRLRNTKVKRVEALTRNFASQAVCRGFKSPQPLCWQTEALTRTAGRVIAQCACPPIALPAICSPLCKSLPAKIACPETDVGLPNSLAGPRNSDVQYALVRERSHSAKHDVHQHGLDGTVAKNAQLQQTSRSLDLAL